MSTINIRLYAVRKLTFSRSTIVEQLPNLAPATFVGHFFYVHSQETRHNADDVFRSFIKQIIVYLDAIGKACSNAMVDAVTHYFGADKPTPSFNELIEDLFVPLCTQLTSSAFVIDGLEICDQAEVFKVLRVWKKVTSIKTLRWLLSGRESVERDFNALYTQVPSIRISEEVSKIDIKTFIDWRVSELSAERRLTMNESLLDEVRSRLNAKAHKM